MVQGAIDGLQAEGLNNVGIYASPGVWNRIVGDYQPAVPYWMAVLGERRALPTAPTRSQWTTKYQLPTGPVVMVQYTDGYNGRAFDGDYAC